MMRTLIAILLVAVTVHAEDRTVTLQFERLPVRAAVREIAEQAQINIAIDQSVRGFVTADLRDADPRFALRAIAQQVGADVKEEHGVLRVVPTKRARV